MSFQPKSSITIRKMLGLEEEEEEEVVESNSLENGAFSSMFTFSDVGIDELRLYRYKDARTQKEREITIPNVLERPIFRVSLAKKAGNYL